MIKNKEPVRISSKSRSPVRSPTKALSPVAKTRTSPNAKSRNSFAQAAKKKINATVPTHNTEVGDKSISVNIKEAINTGVEI